MHFLSLIGSQTTVIYAQMVHYLGIASIPFMLQILTLSVLALGLTLLLSTIGYIGYRLFNSLSKPKKAPVGQTLKKPNSKKQNKRKIRKKPSQKTQLSVPEESLSLLLKSIPTSVPNLAEEQRALMQEAFSTSILEKLVCDKQIKQLSRVLATHYKEVDAHIMNTMLTGMLGSYFNNPNSVKQLMFLFVSFGLHKRVFENQDTILSLILKIDTEYYFPVRFQALEFLINRLPPAQLNAPDAQGKRALDYIYRAFIEKPQDRLNNAKLINLCIEKGANIDLMGPEVTAFFESVDFNVSHYEADAQILIQDVISKIKNQSKDAAQNPIPQEPEPTDDELVLTFNKAPVLIAQNLSCAAPSIGDDLQNIQPVIDQILTPVLEIPSDNAQVQEADHAPVPQFVTQQEIGKQITDLSRAVKHKLFQHIEDTLEQYHNSIQAYDLECMLRMMLSSNNHYQKEEVEQLINVLVKYNLHTRVFEDNTGILLILCAIKKYDDFANITGIAVEFLLSYLTPAQINIQDTKGNTALSYVIIDNDARHYADFPSHHKNELFDLLIRHGADLNLIEEPLKNQVENPATRESLVIYVVRQIIESNQGNQSISETLFNPESYKGVTQWVLSDLIESTVYEVHGADAVFEFFLRSENVKMIQLCLENIPSALSQQTLDSVIASRNRMVFFKNYPELVVLLLKNTNISLSREKTKQVTDCFSLCFRLAVDIIDPIVETAMERFIASELEQDKNAVDSVFAQKTNRVDQSIYYPELEALIQSQNDAVALPFLKHFISLYEVSPVFAQACLKSAYNANNTKVIAYICENYSLALDFMNSSSWLGCTFLFNILQQENSENLRTVVQEKASALFNIGARCAAKEYMLTYENPETMAKSEQCKAAILTWYNTRITPIRELATTALVEAFPFNGGKIIGQIVAEYYAPPFLEIDMVNQDNHPCFKKGSNTL